MSQEDLGLKSGACSYFTKQALDASVTEDIPPDGHAMAFSHMDTMMNMLVHISRQNYKLQKMAFNR